MTIDNIEPIVNTFPEIEQCECPCVCVYVCVYKRLCLLLTKDTGDRVEVLADCENDMNRGTDRLNDVRDPMDLKRGREGWYKRVVKGIKRSITVIFD